MGIFTNTKDATDLSVAGLTEAETLIVGVSQLAKEEDSLLITGETLEWFHKLARNILEIGGGS